MVKSPKFSLKGWKFKEWALHNYDKLKELIKVLIPLLVGIKFIKNNPALITIVTIAGKMFLDTLEFWYKEKQL